MQREISYIPGSLRKEGNPKTVVKHMQSVRLTSLSCRWVSWMFSSTACSSRASRSSSEIFRFSILSLSWDSSERIFSLSFCAIGSTIPGRFSTLKKQKTLVHRIQSGFFSQLHCLHEGEIIWMLKRNQILFKNQYNTGLLYVLENIFYYFL